MRKNIDSFVAVSALLLTSFGFSSSMLAAAAPSLVSPAIGLAQAQIPNLLKVDDNLYRGRAPNAQALTNLKSAGIKVDLSLDNDKQAAAEEQANAQRLGMEYINIPLSPFHRPSNNEVSTFLAVLGNKDQEPVYVHCKHGQDRTGAMIGIYRMMHNGWTADQAYEEMLQDGFHPMFTALSNTLFDYGRALGLSAHKPTLGFIATHLGPRSAAAARTP